MRAYERFLKYVTIHTRSDETSDTTPSTARQFDLAKLLVEELHAMGITDARVDENCYVYASIPATIGCETQPALGFIAHLDTADFEAQRVLPQMHEHYDGGTLKLKGATLSPEMFPHLKRLAGRTLITSDGTTLLGADDKAGIAEIMTMAEQILEKKLPHGRICIAFTPDEEIGRGADAFDVAGFGAQYAYTVDGGPEGEIEFENFNAGEATVLVNGVDVHPGSAKGVMVNAQLVAMEFNAMLPQAETPRLTEGYEGFYHLMRMEGDTTHAKLRYIIRDHDAAGYENRKRTMQHILKTLQEKWGDIITLELRDQYRNMREIIEQHPQLITRAENAARAARLVPEIVPIRGGTDGARLSYMGLPCPNLGTGGYAFHGPYEHITVEGMDAVVEMLVNLAKEND